MSKRASDDMPGVLGDPGDAQVLPGFGEDETTAERSSHPMLSPRSSLRHHYCAHVLILFAVDLLNSR